MPDTIYKNALDRMMYKAGLTLFVFMLLLSLVPLYIVSKFLLDARHWYVFFKTLFPWLLLVIVAFNVWASAKRKLIDRQAAGVTLMLLGIVTESVYELLAHFATGN